MEGIRSQEPEYTYGGKVKVKDSLVIRRCPNVGHNLRRCCVLGCVCETCV